MPTTPNHDIYYPDSQTNLTPLEAHFAALAASVDNAIPRFDSGTDVIPVGGGSWTFISFREGLFAGPPVVVASVSDVLGVARGITIRAFADSSSSFRVHATAPPEGTEAETVRIAWIAIQQ